MKYFHALLFLIIIQDVNAVNQQLHKTSIDHPTLSISKYSSDSILLNRIIITGNRKTQERIILRELTFSAGFFYNDKMLDMLIDESYENLINTSLFNFVTISRNALESKDDSIEIHINVKERWYTWPFPVIEINERNFNTWWETKNLSRLNYGLSLRQENFRGRRETLELVFSTGFDEEFGIAYLFPYINKLQTLGLGFGFGLKRNHEVFFKTYRNKLQYFKDDKDYLQKDQFLTLMLTLRRGIHNTHSLQIQARQYDLHDTLIILNPLYSYKNLTRLPLLSALYQFKNDYRDYKHYPLRGHYFDFEIENLGFGLFNNKGLQMLSLQTTYRKFWNIQKKFYYAAGLMVKLSGDGFQPYLLQQGLGFESDFVRGYEYYVIDGQHLALFKSNLKYELLPKRIKTIPLIPFNKFKTIHYALYLNIFADMAYVDDNTHLEGNFLNNSFLFGYGAGMDLVTYYDSILRIEFALNRLKESGIFIHFTAPI